MAKDYRGFDSSSDSGRNYASGAWGGGELDAAGLAAKYNLDTSQKGRGDGHIWGRNADGSEVYIGKSSMDLAANEGLISNHSKQAGDEIDHSGVPESLSSLGDIKGAILTEWNGGAAAPTAEPETDEGPVKLSPEILQAKARVAKYEGDILSGETSRRIYGNNQNFLDNYKLNLQNSQTGSMSKYQFDPNSNSAGATDMSPAAQQYEPNEFSGSDISPYETPEPTSQATSNFLKNQKQKTIKDYNIQRVTNLA